MFTHPSQEDKCERNGLRKMGEDVPLVRYTVRQIALVLLAFVVTVLVVLYVRR